jgi:hypothetical protein
MIKVEGSMVQATGSMPDLLTEFGMVCSSLGKALKKDMKKIGMPEPIIDALVMDTLKAAVEAGVETLGDAGEFKMVKAPKYTSDSEVEAILENLKNSELH